MPSRMPACWRSASSWIACADDPRSIACIRPKCSGDRQERGGRQQRRRRRRACAAGARCDRPRRVAERAGSAARRARSRRAASARADAVGHRERARSARRLDARRVPATEKRLRPFSLASYMRDVGLGDAARRRSGRLRARAARTPIERVDGRSRWSLTTVERSSRSSSSSDCADAVARPGRSTAGG